MIFFLSFMLSWLSGITAILLAAFVSYESFSIVDITSFAALTLAGCAIVIPLLYISSLGIIKKKVTGKKQFLAFPLTLVSLANLPVYFFIWFNTNNLYGRSEAVLFFLSFSTTAAVFGLSWAWKNNFQKKIRPD